MSSTLDEPQQTETREELKNENLCVPDNKRPIRKTRGQINKDMVASLYSSDEVEGAFNKAHLMGDLGPKKLRKKKFKAKKSSKLYSCEFCPAIFASNTQLRFHAKIHLSSPSKIYECDECNVVFSRLNKLMKHKQKIHLKLLQCKHCNANFNRINSLRLHMRLHSGERPFSCNECGAKFVQSSHLNIHKRSHTGEKPYQCDVCKVAFKQISHLRSHERIHTQDKPYACTSCGSSFIQKSSLNRHMRIHTGEKPYICTICQAAFCVKNNLTRHMIIHTGIQPYHCDLCGSSFNQAIDLKRHKIAHTGIKPFKCDECDSSFSRKSNLKWHKFIHTGETPFKCDVCPAEFMKPRDLKKHKLNHQSNCKLEVTQNCSSHFCTLCNTQFPTEIAAKLHMLGHTGGVPLSCDKCPELLPDEASLKSHMQTHAGSHACTVCGKKFSAQRTLKKHAQQCHSNKMPLAPQEVNDSIPLDQNVDEKQVVSNVFVTQTPQAKVEHVENHPQQQQAMQHQIGYLQMQDFGQGTALQVPAPCIINASDSPSQPLERIFTAGSIGPSNVPTIVQTQVPTLMVSSGSGQPVRTGKPATDCQNHSLHVLILNGNNQWQSWCFCETPNVSTIASGIPSVEYMSSGAVRPIEYSQAIQVQQQKPSQELPLQQNLVQFTSDNLQTATLRPQVADISTPQTILQMYNNQSSCEPVQQVILGTTSGLQLSLQTKNISAPHTLCEGHIATNSAPGWTSNA